MERFRKFIARVVIDCLTGPDGKTFAFGRVAAACLLVGHALAVSVFGGSLLLVSTPTWTDAAAFVAAVAATYAIVVEAAQRLVRLTNSIEPEQ
jgi:hypothetical protein